MNHAGQVRGSYWDRYISGWSQPKAVDLYGAFNATESIGVHFLFLEDPMTASSIVLIVEDDAFVRDIFQRCLERAGFQVRTAAHGREALTSFHKGGVGLVLTDIPMPELDGFQLIQALKWWAPKLPVIAISVMNDVSSCRDTVDKLGAELAVCKPVSPHELVKMVRQFTTSSSVQ